MNTTTWGNEIFVAAIFFLSSIGMIVAAVFAFFIDQHIFATIVFVFLFGLYMTLSLLSYKQYRQGLNERGFAH